MQEKEAVKDESRDLGEEKQRLRFWTQIRINRPDTCVQDEAAVRTRDGKHSVEIDEVGRRDLLFTIAHKKIQSYFLRSSEPIVSQGRF